MKPFREIVLIFMVLWLMLGMDGPAHAESNLPPPEADDSDSPISAIEDNNTGNSASSDQNSDRSTPTWPLRNPAQSSSVTATGGDNSLKNQDVFKNKGMVSPAAYQNDTKVSVRSPGTLSWDWQSGGAYSTAVECGDALYGVTDRLLHTWDKDSFQEKGEFDLGSPIRSLSCRVLGGQYFVLAVLEEPSSLVVLEVISAGVLQMRQSLPLMNAEVKSLAEGIFVQTNIGISDYDLDQHGNFRLLGQIPLQQDDLFYPFGHLFYFYHKATRTLELWDKDVQETLASIDLDGDPVFLTLVREPARRDAEGRALEARAKLFFLMTSPSSTASAPLYEGVYQIPIRATTGLFLNAGREIAFPSAATAAVLDDPKNTLYLKLAERAVWQVFDLMGAVMEKGEWDSALVPVPARGTGLFFVSPTAVYYKDVVKGEDNGDGVPFELHTLRERHELTAASRVEVDADGKSAVFFAKDVTANPKPFQVRFSPSGGMVSHPLWSDPAVADGHLRYVAPYWFLQDGVTGKLYLSKTIDPPAWQELALPGLTFGKKLDHIRYTLAPTATADTIGIWLASTYEDEQGVAHGEVKVYTLSIGGKTEDLQDKEFSIGGPIGDFSDFKQVYEAIPLSADGRYIAVAAGDEGLVLLAQADHSDVLERVHHKADPTPTIRCERVFLSPSRTILAVAFRDERVPASPKAVLNFYDVSSEVKFPMYLSQLTDIPLVRQGEGVDLPALAFAHGESQIAMALGDTGLGLLSMDNPASPSFALETFAGQPIVDVSTDRSGERLCAAASDAGVICGQFK